MGKKKGNVFVQAHEATIKFFDDNLLVGVIIAVATAVMYWHYAWYIAGLWWVMGLVSGVLVFYLVFIALKALADKFTKGG